MKILYRRIKLFFGIVWRIPGPGLDRLDWETSREVANIIWPRI
jgi:hypothetical protein